MDQGVRSGEAADRRQAEEALRFRAIFENTPKIAVQGYDRERRVIFWNSASEQLYGYAAQDALGRRLEDLIIPPEIRSMVVADVDGWVGGGPSIPPGELCLMRADGSPIWVYSSHVMLHNLDGQPEMYCIDIDLGAQRAALDALRESEARFRLLAENMQDVIWQVGTDLVFTYVSPSSVRQGGFRPDELVGRSLLEILSEDSVELVRRRVGARLAAGLRGEPIESTSYVLEQRCKDGGFRWTEVVSTPIRDASGALVGFQGMTRDVHERVRMERQRQEMERQLLHAQKLESLGVLAGGIAHDFNNLLAAVVGNLDLALRELPAAPAARHGIDEAMSAARRATDLTRQMLAYSGRGKFAVGGVDLNRLVAENAQMLRVSIPRNIQLEVRLGEDLPQIQADPGQVQQVVMNLLTNAAEAVGTQAGLVQLATGVGLFDAVQLRRSELDRKPLPGRFVWLEVADTGCGMDEETRRRLFDPFFTTKFTGRGLGMSAVHGIVRGHGGALTIDSIPGRGTTIRVLLPVAVEAVRPPPNLAAEISQAAFAIRDSAAALHRELLSGDGAAASPPCGAEDGAVPAAAGTVPDQTAPAAVTLPYVRPARVLVVDDEESLREMCREMLACLGHDAVGARDGEHAVELFARDPSAFDVVILDLTMPRLDGVATYEALRVLRPDVTAVLCSGFSEQEAVQRFAGQRLAGFVQKPYDLMALQSALAAALEGLPG